MLQYRRMDELQYIYLSINQFTYPSYPAERVTLPYPPVASGNRATNPSMFDCKRKLEYNLVCSRNVQCDL